MKKNIFFFLIVLLAAMSHINLSLAAGATDFDKSTEGNRSYKFVFVASLLANPSGVSAFWKNREPTISIELEDRLGQAVENHHKIVPWGDLEEEEVFAQVTLGNPLSRGKVPTEAVYGTMFKTFEKKAQEGDVHAQNVLGFFYARGDGVDQNFEEAVKWWEISANQGCVAALHTLGSAYFQGAVVEQDYTEARYWLEQAAEKGDMPAQNAVGFTYHYGKGVDQNYDQARLWYILAASNGYKEALYNLGVLCKDERGGFLDSQQIIHWWEDSAERNYTPAQHALGDFYFYGKYVPLNYTRALEWYSKAALQGHEKAGKKKFFICQQEYGENSLCMDIKN